MRSINLTGNRFGKWTVIEQAERPPSNSPSKPLYWKCKCDCGTVKVIPSHNLRGSQTKSCGCNLGNPDFVSLFRHLVTLTKKRNMKCDLTFTEFLSFTLIKECHYCHSPIQWKTKGQRSYHLDRKDNDVGYNKHNCVVCCPRCNLSRTNRYTYQEWYIMNEYFRKLRNVPS